MTPANPPQLPNSPSLKWDIFCKVVDNFGDMGVCWRLACNLAARGQTVRLWADDASPLAWMAPSGCANVEIIACKNGVPVSNQAAAYALGDVLMDTFGCEFAIYSIAKNLINTSASSLNIIKYAKNKPIWINLEYLTAESFAERSHTLPYMHHSGPAEGWTQHYFYPGFNLKTGGLLREIDLFVRQKAFDRTAWLTQLLGRIDESKNIDNTRFISLFCYEPAALETLIDQLSVCKTPICLLVTAGRATHAVKAVLERKKQHQPTYLFNSLLLILYLPQLTQIDFDHLLWSCDLNFVRGEDSLVRAIWAAKPFIWQIYPQHDGVHHAKLDAFLAMMDAPASLKTAHIAWNASAAELASDPQLPRFPALDLSTWAQTAQNLSKKLRSQDDLVTNLIAFVALSREKQLKS
jgi:uncharacterized repeat protein (TIGR03837 family)